MKFRTKYTVVYISVMDMYGKRDEGGWGVTGFVTEVFIVAYDDEDGWTGWQLGGSDYRRYLGISTCMH